MSKVDILASYWTIAGGAYPHTDHEYSVFDLRARAEAAGRAGFKGMGIWHADLEHNLRKYSLADLKRIFADNGIVHIELEFLTDWFLPPGERKAKSDLTRKLLLDAAQALGARHIKVGDFYRERPPQQQLVDAWAKLCADGAGVGTKILFEMMPFGFIDSLESALALFDAVKAPNSGIILDLWHIVKIGIPYRHCAAFPAHYLGGIEINDGWLKNMPDLTEETTKHRQLCGEGEFDVKGFVRAMLDAGYRGPWGVEVLNAELREQPLDTIVQRAWTTTAAQFD